MVLYLAKWAIAGVLVTLVLWAAGVWVVGAEGPLRGGWAVAMVLLQPAWLFGALPDGQPPLDPGSWRGLAVPAVLNALVYALFGWTLWLARRRKAFYALSVLVALPMVGMALLVATDAVFGLSFAP